MNKNVIATVFVFANAVITACVVNPSHPSFVGGVIGFTVAAVIVAAVKFGLQRREA